MAKKTVEVDEELLRAADADFQRAVDAEAQKRVEAYKLQHAPLQRDAAVEADAQAAREAAKKLKVPVGDLVKAVDAGCTDLQTFRDAEAKQRTDVATKIAAIAKPKAKDEERKTYADHLAKLPLAELTLMLDTLGPAKAAPKRVAGAGPAVTGQGDAEDTEPQLDTGLTVGNWDPKQQKWVQQA